MSTAYKVAFFAALLALIAAVALMASEPACGQVVPATAPGVEPVLFNEGKCP